MDVDRCYIRITDDAGKTWTYGVLGDQGTMADQKPRRNDNLGPGGSDRNSGGKCKDVPGSECQKQKLIEGLNDAADSGTCPSCGANDRFWFATDLLHFFDGYNSNTWVYNMILGAGMTPPNMGGAPGYHKAPGDWYR